MTTKQPKILYLITKSNFGGAQKYVYELALAAKKRNHNVIVACGGTGTKQAGLGKLADLLKESAIQVLPVKHFMRDISLLEEIRAFFEVITILRKEKPDVFHVTSSKAGGLGALAGRLTGCKRIVFTSHGLTMDESWRPKWQIKLITFFTWFTIFLAHHTIMISTETYLRVSRMPLLSKKVSLVFNGVSPISFFEKTEAKNKLALTNRLPNDVTLIGGIGELHPNKNWRQLILAMPYLHQNVHLIIMSEGEEKPYLERQIKELGLEDRVHLPGYVHEAARYLKMLDIFILPSKKEGLPYVILEAAMAHLPVIASDLPGNRDIIIDNESGFLVDPNPEVLAESVKRFIREPNLHQTFSQTLNSVVTKKFSMKKMIDNTFAVYFPSNITSDC